MFTWICPKCGREVPPAYDECPDCKEAEAGQAQAAPPLTPQQPSAIPPQAQVQPTSPPPQYQPPMHQPQGPYQPQQAYQVPPTPQVTVRPYAPPPPPAGGLPGWLLTILVALATLGVVAGVVWTIGYFRNRPETKPSAVVESPAAKPGMAAHPLQRFIEVSGVRFVEDPKKKNKVLAKFLVTNHSDTAEISGLAANVTVWGATRKSEEDAQGTFTFKTDLKPLETKDLTEPFNTKLKIYELPDWQNVTTDLQVTAPPAK